MATSLNRAMLIGNLGRDPENRVTANQNIPVSTFSVATTNSYKGKDGNWVNETTWHNIVYYNISEYLKGSLKKGSKVYIEGRINNRDYTDKEGNKRYTSEVIAERILLLDAKEGTGNYGGATTPPFDQPPMAETPDSDLPF